MIEPQHIAVVIVALLLASAVSSTLGFGIGLTSGPILLLALDPQTSVVLINTVGILIVVLVLRQTWRLLSLREMAPIAAAGLLGAPVGAYALGSVDPGPMRVLIALLVLAVTALIISGVSVSIRRPRLLGPPIAFVVSGLITSSGVGGPIMALYLLHENRGIHELRGALAAFFLVVMTAGVAGYGVSGLLTAERMILALVAILPVLAGFRVSALLLRRMDRADFRKAVLVLIVASSVIVLVRELIPT